MAWLNTDWGKELEQVELKINEVLSEKIEPLADRIVVNAATEASTVILKASFELHESTDYFFTEMTAQRKALVSDMKTIICYGAVAAFVVIVGSAIVIKLLNPL